MRLRRSFPKLACLAAVMLLAHCDGNPDTVTVYDGSLPGDDDSGSNTLPDGGKAHKDTGVAGDDSGQGDDASGDDDSSDNGDTGQGTDPITGDGCAGGTCLNPTCKALNTAVDPGPNPETGFDIAPSFIPNDVIIPTFDDVPDGSTDPSEPDYKVYGAGNWTKGDVDWLNTNKLHMDFFINTNNWCGDVLQDTDCQATIVSILKTQNAANHTIHHIHMGIAGTAADPGCATAADCEAEITGVESLVAKLSNGGRPHLTRFRAPYGEPYQANGPGLAMVQGVVAKYGVEVDWNLDSGDSTCNSTTAPCFTGADIAKNVEDLVGAGPGASHWGILLMHGVFPWTRDAVPLLFGPNGELTKRKFRIGTVEDAICWKFGKHSWEIVAKNSGQPRSPN